MPAAFHELAVVPVFVNAGAAILPAIAAGIVSAIGLLFRPRALIAACRQRPKRATAVLVALIAAGGLAYGISVLRAAPAPQPKPGTDWLGLARILAAERANPHAVLKLAWHNPIDDEMGLATPAILKESTGATLFVPAMMYTTDQQYGTFWALDAATGQKQWKTSRATLLGSDTAGETLRPIFSCPLVVAGGTRIVTGQGLHDNANCSLVCFDIDASRRAGAGRANWTVPTTLHLESSPARVMVAGKECVVIGAGAIEGPDKKAVGDPGFVFCVEVATGRKLWQFPLNDPEAAIAVDDEGTVYAGAGINGNAVVALQSAENVSPREVWRIKTTHPATGDLLLTKNEAGRKLLLLGTGNGDYVNAAPNPAGSVKALDPKTGQAVWETPLPDGVLGRLTVGEGRLYAACRDGNAYALSLQDGQILWKTQISKTPRIPVLAGIVSDGHYAFALAADATLAVLRLEDGAVLESRELGDPAKFTQNFTMASPVIADHRLYLSTEVTGVWAFDIGW